MDSVVRQYLQEIGRRGGKQSRRKLSREAAQSMVLVREARRAFKCFYSRCFWSYDPELRVTANDVKWIGERLMTYGGQEGWELGAKLCR